MQTLPGRLVLLAVLLVAGFGAVYSTWTTARQVSELDRSGQDTANQLDRILRLVDAVTAAQQASVTPSRDPETEPIPPLIDQIGAETSALRPLIRSVNGGRTIESVVASVRALSEIQARAHEHVRLGQDLMATDLIFSEARAATDAITSGLRELRAAESAALASERAVALRYGLTIIASVAVVWALGLIALTPVRAPRPAEEASASLLSPVLVPHAIEYPATESAPGPNFSTAADLCTAMGRLTTAADLPELLTRAAAILDATGIVVWMAGGEELFPTTAFGYPPQIISRLGPINRSALNATAAAWRTGKMQIVIGDAVATGALVAPMLGPDRCIGVLAVEVPHGREEEPAARAVTTIFAAQLATTLAGWPPASAAAPQAPPLDRAAQA